MKFLVFFNPKLPYGGKTMLSRSEINIGSNSLPSAAQAGQLLLCKRCADVDLGKQGGIGGLKKMRRLLHSLVVDFTRLQAVLAWFAFLSFCLVFFFFDFGFYCVDNLRVPAHNFQISLNVEFCSEC
ncbi:MAG: hypothetical protein ACLUKN_00410 [Bacilli bacterium]